MVYGIEPSLYKDGSKYFSVNPSTGEVFLQESLIGNANEQFYLLVTANDGHQTVSFTTFFCSIVASFPFPRYS